MAKKTKYLLFPKLHLKHLLFLFFFVISCIKKGMQIYFEQNQRIEIEFLKLYIYDFGDFLSIIPLIIMKKRMKNKKIEEKIVDDTQSDTSRSNIDYIYNKADANKSECVTFRNIFIFTIVDFIAQISSVVFYIVTSQQKLVVKQANLNSALVFNILAIILFSILLLHTKVNRHHIFALCIDIICLVFLGLIDITMIIQDGNEIGISLIYIFIRIFSAVLYSLENTLAKIILFYNYISSYSLLFIKSIIHFIYLIIFSFPFIFIELEDKNGNPKSVFVMIRDIFDDKIFILIVILYTINSFFYNNLCMKIIDVFSPNHFVISRIFENFGVFIIDLAVNGANEMEDYVLLRLIMFILLIIAAFIYTEFLVINVCGLGNNTYLFLYYESKEEISNDKMIERNNNDDEQGIEIPEIKTENERETIIYD